MAQVPYSPVPDVAMQDISTPKISTGAAVEEAAGVPIGRAMQGLGKVLEHSGDELYKTAMALQEQKNQAEALEGELRFSGELSDIQARFASSEGRIPSDKLMEYRGEVDSLRKKHRESLSSDAVRRTYDRNAIRTQEIAIRNGASHAAAQLKQYTHKQNAAAINLEKQRVYDNPNDPIDQPLDRVEELVRDAGVRGGHSPEQINEEVRKHRGEVTATRIEGMAYEKPETAQQMLDIAIERKQLWGDQAIKLQKIVTSKLEEVESRNISEAIASDPTVSREEAVKQAKADAEEKRPGDAVFRDRVVADTEAKVNRNIRFKKDDQADAKETVNNAIMNPEVKTFDDLLRLNKGIDKVIERTPGNYKKEIQGMINRYQAAINKPRNDEEFGRVSAMRLNDPIAFAEVDATKLDISTAQMNQIGAWQKADRKKPHENAKVTQAQQWIREAKGAELRALEIYSREKGKNDEAYDKYTNALSIAIDLWYDNHKKLPDRNQVINEIAPTLINREMEKGIFGGFFGTQREKTPALINEPVPKEWEDTLRAEARKQYGRELETFEVGREWLRKRLKDVEKAKKAAEGLP